MAEEDPSQPQEPGQPQSQGQPATGEGGTITPTNKDSKNMAMLAHLLGIFTGFIAALIIWLIKKHEDPYVDDQAKEALNFQITVLIAFVVSWLAMFILIGFLLLPAVAIANIILCILAAVAATRGEQYRYPICLRLVQ